MDRRWIGDGWEIDRRCIGDAVIAVYAEKHCCVVTVSLICPNVTMCVC